MSKETLTRKYPLNCPFCDEPAYPAGNTHRIVSPFAVYTLRECEIGHKFYSVETIPEDQSAVVDEIARIKEAMKEIRDGTD